MNINRINELEEAINKLSEQERIVLFDKISKMKKTNKEKLSLLPGYARNGIDYQLENDVLEPLNNKPCTECDGIMAWDPYFRKFMCKKCNRTEERKTLVRR